MKTTESFIVGQVFQHRNKNLIPQFFGNDFKNWLWISAQEKRVFINVFEKNNLKEYVLLKNMNNTTIQRINNSIPMKEDQFWVILYLLIINPKLGKKILKYKLLKDKFYVFHLKLNSRKVIALGVGWNGDEWFLDAFDFHGLGLWMEDYDFVFLFHTIIEK